MVYLLHSYFGRDGRDEAEELLERQSGNRDKPRILEAFNEPIDNWLDFFMFTMFTDRDGKSQLMSLSESSLDPLSRTTRFMLTEEAHHMFVGETGIARILERTCQLMKQAGFSEDVRKLGGIDIPTIQKHLNQWFSLSLDLHGSEVSSNAASYFANGLKGRAKEDTFDEHVVKNAVLQHGVLRGRQAGHQGSADAQRHERGAARLVRRRLRRRRRRAGTGSSSATACRIGCGCPIASSTAASACIPASTSIRTACRCRTSEWERRKYEWLPSAADSEYLLSIMASRSTSRASSPTTSRRRAAASTSSRSTSSTSGRNSNDVDRLITDAICHSPGSVTRRFCSRRPAASGSCSIPGSTTNPSTPESAKKVGEIDLMLVTHGHERSHRRRGADRARNGRARHRAVRSCRCGSSRKGCRTSRG